MQHHHLTQLLIYQNLHLSPAPPELGDTKHQKKLVFQPSDSWEHHPRSYGRRTNNWRSVILSNFQIISLHFFELDDIMTIQRASSISNSKKWKIRASCTSERYPRQKYTVNKVLCSRISAFLVDPQFRTSSSERAAYRKFFKAQYLSIALESGKVVRGNPPKCGASRFWA